MKFLVYNTLTGEKEEVIPIEEGKIRLYTCGPTVYDYAHIGNLRTYIFEDHTVFLHSGKILFYFQESFIRLHPYGIIKLQY